MDIEFDFKGDPVGGVITKCKDWEAFCVCVYKSRKLTEYFYLSKAFFYLTSFSCAKSSNHISLIFIADLLEKVIFQMFGHFVLYMLYFVFIS